MSYSGQLLRPALGQVSAIGDLYDARTDSFCGASVFKKKIPAEAISSVDNPFSDIQLIHSDTFSEKFSRMNVEGELQVSVLAGLFNLQGSGRFLTDQKESARTVKSSLIYSIKTKEESLNIFHEDLKSAFILDAITSVEATHLVKGVSWGANCVLSSEYHNIENRDVKEIEGSLNAQLKIIAASMKGAASVNFSEGNNRKDLHFKIHVYGDILPSKKDLPTTFDGALNLMKKIPSLAAKFNNGYGKPLVYTLIPISLLQNYLQFSFGADRILKSLEKDVLLRIVKLFENLSQVKQELHDFHQDADNHKFCITSEDMKKILSLKNDFDVSETKFRSSLASTLCEVRSGKANVGDLENIIKGFQSEELSPDNVSARMSSWSHITQKVSFAKTLISNGVTYIGLGTSLDDETTKVSDSLIYILYLKENERSSTPWKENYRLFLQKKKIAGSNEMFFVLDCDIHHDQWPTLGPSIQVMKKFQVLTDNLLEEHKKMAKTPMAQCTTEMTRSTDKPNKRTYLEIPCAGTNCDQKSTYLWTCPKCKDKIEYGFDDKLYCSCGNGLANSYEFKCSDSKHGNAFKKFDEHFLQECLSKLRPFKEINILILGETGVGKFTWINGFQNYLNYQTLQKAENSELLTLIPTSFTVCDKDFNLIKVSTGKDKNEIYTTGQSATQSPQVYSFLVEDTLIRLIDTPGIGDTRGIEQDNKNFEEILNTLSKLDELHGICILLKPNNARLTVMFEFCIKELLTYLHRDASQNIIFCFTNSRGTFYRPGETMPVLRDLLEKNQQVKIKISAKTVYCFDSEAYRFLAAVKNKSRPVEFSDDERANFAKSWEMSILETKRMLKHISELTPHSTKSTLDLNHARNIVLKLTRPLAEISNVIQTNKDVILDFIEELKKTKATIKDLEKKKYFPKVELEIIKIDYPKTVCTNSSCKTIYGQGDHKQTDYHTICHSPCQLKGVDHELVGDEKLLHCACIENTMCKTCFHSYREHMHIYYESKQVIKMVEDVTVSDLLRSKLTEEEKKQIMINDKKSLIDELEQEIIQIDQASVKFACFLKHNAITPYNDAMLAYMNHLIREEKDKIACGGSDKTLKNLEKHRDSYQEQIKILDRQMKKGPEGKSFLSPSGVDDLVKKLCKLKHNGKALQSSLDAGKSSSYQLAIYKEKPAQSSVSKLFSKFHIF